MILKSGYLSFILYQISSKGLQGHIREVPIVTKWVFLFCNFLAFLIALIFKIEQLHPYSNDYSECIDEAKRDQRLEIRPELKEFPNSLKEYDVIFLGFPNFWGTMPMAMFNLLENINLNDKIIKPFCSHEGSGLGRSIEDIRRLCPDSIVKEGFAIHGKNFIEEDLKNWINK